MGDKPTKSSLPVPPTGKSGRRNSCSVPTSNSVKLRDLFENIAQTEYRRSSIVPEKQPPPKSAVRIPNPRRRSTIDARGAARQAAASAAAAGTGASVASTTSSGTGGSGSKGSRRSRGSRGKSRSSKSSASAAAAAAAAARRDMAIQTSPQRRASQAAALAAAGKAGPPPPAADSGNPFEPASAAPNARAAAKATMLSSGHGASAIAAPAPADKPPRKELQLSALTTAKLQYLRRSTLSKKSGKDSSSKGDGKTMTKETFTPAKPPSPRPGPSDLAAERGPSGVDDDPSTTSIGSSILQHSVSQRAKTGSSVERKAAATSPLALADGLVGNLVLEGAGSQAVAFCGAVRMLEEQGILAGISQFAGNSGGALVAALLAVGYSSTEMLTLLMAKDYSDLIGREPGDAKIGGGFAKRFKLRTEYGPRPGAAFHAWVGDLLAAKVRKKNADITFAQLYEEKATQLVITATSITSKQVRMYHRFATPDLPVRDAVRISHATPFLLAAVEDGQGDVLVEGSLLNHYPVYVFDSDLGPDYTMKSAVNGPLNRKTLGMKLYSGKEITDRAAGRSASATDNVDLSQFSADVVSAIRSVKDTMRLKPGDVDRTIAIDTLDFPPHTLALTTKQKTQLVQEGFKAAEKFLNRWMWQDFDLNPSS